MKQNGAKNKCSYEGILVSFFFKNLQALNIEATSKQRHDVNGYCGALIGHIKPRHIHFNIVATSRRFVDVDAALLNAVLPLGSIRCSVDSNRQQEMI